MALNRRKLLGTGAGLSATGLAAAACGGGSTTGTGTNPAPSSASSASGSSNPLANGSSPTSSAKPSKSQINAKGIINLVCTSAFEHLDPQNIYVNTSQAIGRLMFRTLMGWQEDPSQGTFKLVPDLAAAMPVATDNNQTWTFKLKPGLKFDDGTPITSADLKYGIERSMDPNIPYGPQYAKQYLVGADKYTGPAKGASLKSIVVPDANTIVFKLIQPVGTWAELCTMSTFTPVPKAKDTGKNYDLNPVCMGPYKIQSYQQTTKLVLVPNTYWDPATDNLRSQYFAQVNCQMNVNEAQVDNDLFSDVDGGTSAMFIDNPIPADIAKAGSAQYASRTEKAATIFQSYYAVQLNQPALKDQRVRQALIYARDPGASLKAAGGPLLGAPTQSLVPPTLDGFTDVKDVYPDLGPDGNPAKAKQLLQEAKVTDLKVTLPYSNSGASAAATVQVVVQAYARAGITLIPKPLNPNNYYTTIGALANKFDLVSVGWGFDIPDCSTIFPPLFRGGTNIYDGSANYGRLNLPSLDKQMDTALKLSPEKALPIWQSMNKFLVEQAYVVPRFNIKTIQLVGSKVKGTYISPVLGTMDIANAYISN